MGTSGPRVLIVTQRMHPNLREAHHAITSRGGACKFVVSRIGPSEPADFADRIIAKHSEITEELLVDIFDTFRPTILVQRNFTGVLVRIWKLAGQRGIPRFVYDQNPVMFPISELAVRPWKVARMAKDLLILAVKLGLHERVSPVHFWGKRGSIFLAGTHYVPFPMRTQPRFARPKNPGLPTVVCIAKHGQKRKRVAWLMRVLKKSPFDFKIEIIGSRPKNESDARYFQVLQKLATQTERTRRLISFHFDLSEEDVHQKLSKAHAFVLPARREQMAISPLEAMAHGIPVLISSDGGAVSYVAPVSTEQIFRSHSFRDFEVKLLNILFDKELSQRLGEMNFQAVGVTHSPSRFWERLKKQMVLDGA